MNNRRLIGLLVGVVVALSGVLIGCASAGSPSSLESTSPDDSTPAAGEEAGTSALPTEADGQGGCPVGCRTGSESSPYAGVSTQIAGLITEPYEPRTGDGVDVVYFESSTACDCMAAVGDAVEYALLTYFRDELESGALRYFLIVSNDPANVDIVEEYDSQAFDLFVVEYRDGQGVAEQVYAIWSLTGDDEAIVEHVRTFIQAALDRQQ